MLRRALMLVCFLVPCLAAGQSPTVLTPSQQLDLRDEFLVQRHALLLDMMRKHDVQMWIIVNEEEHQDPLTQFVAPALPYAGNRELFVFVDGGGAGLKRFALLSFPDDRVTRLFEPVNGQARAVVQKLIADYKPARLALNIGGNRGITRGLTFDSHQLIRSAIADTMATRVVSAAPLIADYLDTRLPAEEPHYRTLLTVTDQIARRALSAEVIEPGKTRVRELRAAITDDMARRGLGQWFRPDVRVQRRGMKSAEFAPGYLLPSPDSLTIQRGDLLHIDFGATYAGLASDWQRMAYVLREGEQTAPKGIADALQKSAELQRAVAAIARPGASNAQVSKDVMDHAQRQGWTALVYSHSIGNHGHGIGPSIDNRLVNAPPTSSFVQPLRDGSYMSIELNTASTIPEWGGQTVYMMLEDNARLTANGYVFFVSQQTTVWVM